MSNNTYQLAVALQAKAIDIIDLHTDGAHTVAHSFGDDIIVVTRHRTGHARRILQIWAHDHDGHLLGSAEADTPCGGGIITSHVTAFRSGHLRWERRVIPTPQQYLNPAALACRSLTEHPSDVQIGFRAYGRADYYLVHDWAPGQSPWTTTWSLLVGTTRTGLVTVRRGVDVDSAVAYAAKLDTHHLTAV